MARKNISSGSDFESQIGYSRAVICHPWVFVSGTTGSVSHPLILPSIPSFPTTSHPPLVPLSVSQFLPLVSRSLRALH